MRKKGDIADTYKRFMKRIEMVPESGCWIWVGNPHKYSQPTGYGQVHFRGTTWLSHRASYTYFKNEIPVGMMLDHLCRVRCCVNPDHLEPVTSKVNTLRGIGPTAIRSAQTHCIYGHALSGHNLIIRKEGWRMCRTCNKRRRMQSMGTTYQHEVTV